MWAETKEKHILTSDPGIVNHTSSLLPQGHIKRTHMHLLYVKNPSVVENWNKQTG